MCGICGQFNFGDLARPADRHLVQAMTRSIAHRGPDDEGYHFDGPLGFGFRRLSIIDLTGGHQPMADAAQSVWVVFNGEIYNFPELRAELESAGHVFRTRSDTEVIVHGYKAWGEGVLDRLNGMFGLAIWDVREQKLVIARDAAGIKLVYFHVDDGAVYFGSELRAVLAAMPRRPGVDMTALNLFLRYRYTPSPLTIYEGVRKLAPGTCAVFQNGRWSVKRWVGASTPPVVPRDDREAAEALLDVYRRALKRHLLSDVPVGLLLSGGLDSGLLLGLMNLHGKQWHTYTVGYGSDQYRDDELVEAAQTAALFNARHATVRIERAEFERSLQHIVSVVEEPVATSSIVPMYFVCQRARADVKVALIGQGPDELFGGYNRHVGVRYGQHWRAMPSWVRDSVSAGIRRLPRNETLKRGVYSLDESNRLRRFQQVLSVMPGATVDGLFRNGMLPTGAGDTVHDLWRDIEPDMAGADELGAFQTLELRSTLPDELLMYADKLSMIHGLEARVPYLDREVVAFARALPASMKIRRAQRKWLHRRVCASFLPPAILARRKRGFGVNVVDQWFKQSLGSRMLDYLADDRSQMYAMLEPAAVRTLLDDHRSGRSDNHKLLFSLVVLEEWLRAGPTSSLKLAA